MHFCKSLIHKIVLVFSLCLIFSAQADTITEPIRTFEAHSSSVKSVAFSPNGQKALSCSTDNKLSNDSILKLWDISTGQLVRTFDGHSNTVWSVAYSPDEQYALSGSSDNTLKLWDIFTGQLIRTFEGHNGNVKSVTFSPNGQYALSGSDDDTMKLWDISTGNLIRTFEDHPGNVQSVAFSPDGETVLSSSSDGYMKLWNANTGNVIRNFEGHSSTVWSVAYSPDGKYALSGGADNTMKLWGVSTGQLIDSFYHPDVVRSVAFSPDGNYALSGGRDHTVKLWNIPSGNLIRTFEGHSTWVTSVAFSPNGQYILSGSDDDTMKLWDTGLESQEASSSKICSIPTGICNYFSIDQAGFYVVTVNLSEGSREGFWGVEFKTSGGVNTGGFNSGAILKEDGDVPGFMAFYLSKAESVNITPYEYSGAVNQMKIQLSQRENGSDTVVFGPTTSTSGQRHTTSVLQPGFYVAEAFSQSGSARGRFGFEVSANSMSGGVNIGGWIDSYTGGNGEGFGALYVAKDQTVNINMFFDESYGSAGAEHLEVKVYRQVGSDRVLVFPIGPYIQY